MIQIWGASVKGYPHQKQRKNQDAWIRAKGQFGTIIAVADGLGSKPHSRQGAQAACLAAKQASIYVSRQDSYRFSSILPILRGMWNAKIQPYSPEECATTCIFAHYSKNGLGLAQLGDGLCLVQFGDSLNVLGCETQPYANLVSQYLGASGQLKWSYRFWPKVEYPATICLATDGISEALQPENYGALTQYFQNEYLYLTPHERYRRLRQELSDYLINNIDDKTLAILHIKGAL